MIQSYLSWLRQAKFMLVVELAGNTARMNAVSRVVDTLLRRQLLQSYLIEKPL